MSFKAKAICIILAVCGLGFVGFVGSTLGYNEDQNWQVIQNIYGTVSIKQTPGYYWKGLSTVWTYPRARQSYYETVELSSRRTGDDTGSKTIDESVSVTFNDSGKAKLSFMIRYRFPTKEDECIQLHRDFANNLDSVDNSVLSYLIYIAKATAPLMTASENQSVRKGEYNNLILAQMKEGSYAMSKTTIELKDRLDEKGKPVTVEAVRIIYEIDENGVETLNPKVSQPSPLEEYGIIVVQLSITETQYDPTTLKQFEAKKEFFLQSEQMKAERLKEREEELMVGQKGLRELAEITAKGNVEKKKAVIEAELKAEVATEAKKEQETKAAMALEVAKINQEEQETIANTALEVAKLRKQTATEDAEAIEILASAEEEKIAKAGAITEKEKVLAEIAAKRDTEVAKHLSMIQTPHTVVGGSGSSNGSDGGYMGQLISLWVLKNMGIISPENSKIPPVVSSPSGSK